MPRSEQRAGRDRVRYVVRCALAALMLAPAAPAPIPGQPTLTLVSGFGAGGQQCAGCDAGGFGGFTAGLGLGASIRGVTLAANGTALLPLCVLCSSTPAQLSVLSAVLVAGPRKAPRLRFKAGVGRYSYSGENDVTHAAGAAAHLGAWYRLAGRRPFHLVLEAFSGLSGRLEREPIGADPPEAVQFRPHLIVIALGWGGATSRGADGR